MGEHLVKVSDFFDKTYIYLHNAFGIRIRAEIVRELLGEARNVRILDVGCGDGSISTQFLHLSNHITLLDLSQNMLSVAASKIPKSFEDHVTFVHGDFLEHNPTQKYDIIICLGVLAHVSSIEKTITHIVSLLAVGGKCIVQITDQDQPLAMFMFGLYKIQKLFSDNYKYTITPTTLQCILNNLHSSGLYVVDKKRYSLLLPGMGILSDKFLYHYQRATLQNPLLSKFGTEVILLISRNQII